MANDNAPQKNVEVNHIKVKVAKATTERVPVSIEITKRRQLDEILNLLEGFTPKEVRQIHRMYKRNRRKDKLQAKNAAQRLAILAIPVA